MQVGGSIFKPLLSSDGLYGDSAIVGTAKIGQDDGLMSKKINSDVGLKYVKGGTSIENQLRTPTHQTCSLTEKLDNAQQMP